MIQRRTFTVGVNFSAWPAKLGPTEAFTVPGKEAVTIKFAPLRSLDEPVPASIVSVFVAGRIAAQCPVAGSRPARRTAGQPGPASC